jgi:hypothetical protein
MSRQLSCGDGASKAEQVEALEVGRVRPNQIGDRIAEQD